MKKYIGLLIISFTLLGCSEKEIVDNEHSWQKYMNEDEFENVQVGMSYEEVVKIAGGQGEEVRLDVYEWPDELLLTQAYEITFENKKVKVKKIIEKRGTSTR
jgi:hypothetical protein